MAPDHRSAGLCLLLLTMSGCQLTKGGERMEPTPQDANGEILLPLRSDIESWLHCWQNVPGGGGLIEERMICCDPMCLQFVIEIWEIGIPDEPLATIKELVDIIWEQTPKCRLSLPSDDVTASVALQFRNDFDAVVQEACHNSVVTNENDRRSVAETAIIRRAVQLLPLSVFSSSQFVTPRTRPARMGMVVVVLIGLLAGFVALNFWPPAGASGMLLWIVGWCVGFGLFGGIATAILFRQPQILFCNAEGTDLTPDAAADEMARHVVSRREELLQQKPGAV